MWWLLMQEGKNIDTEKMTTAIRGRFFFICYPLAMVMGLYVQAVLADHGCGFSFGPGGGGRADPDSSGVGFALPGEGVGGFYLVAGLFDHQDQQEEVLGDGAQYLDA